MSVDVCGSRGAALAARRMGRAVHASIVAFTFSLPQWASLRWPRGREGSSRISSFRNTMLQTAARCHVCLLSEKRDVGLQPLQWAPRTVSGLSKGKAGCHAPQCDTPKDAKADRAQKLKLGDQSPWNTFDSRPMALLHTLGRLFCATPQCSCLLDCHGEGTTSTCGYVESSQDQPSSG